MVQKRTMLGLTAGLLVLWSQGSLAQESTEYVIEQESETSNEESQKPAAQFSMEVNTSQTDVPGHEVDLATYNFAFGYSLTERLQLQAALPIYSGVSKKVRDFSEIGSPFLGANFWAVEFFEDRPLMVGVHGGAKFGQPDRDSIVANKYQEFSGGLMFMKELVRDLDILGKYSYLKKVNEAEPNLDFGDEQDFYLGLGWSPSEDWSFRLGLNARQVAALLRDGEEEVGPATATQAMPEVVYHLSPIMDIQAKAIVPVPNSATPNDVLSSRKRAFGDAASQGALDRSWSVGVNVLF